MTQRIDENIFDEFFETSNGNHSTPTSLQLFSTHAKSRKIVPSRGCQDQLRTYPRFTVQQSFFLVGDLVHNFQVIFSTSKRLISFVTALSWDLNTEIDTTSTMKNLTFVIVHQILTLVLYFRTMSMVSRNTETIWFCINSLWYLRLLFTSPIR